MKFIDTPRDQWHTVGGEDGPMSHPPIKSHSLLTLGQWHAVREQWPAKGSEGHKPVGVILPNDSDIEVLEQDLAKLDLVVLQFPKCAKAQKFLPRSEINQIYDYLRNSKYELGYLINFAPPRAYVKRVIYTNNRKPWLSKLLVFVCFLFVSVRGIPVEAAEFYFGAPTKEVGLGQTVEV